MLIYILQLNLCHDVHLVHEWLCLIDPEHEFVAWKNMYIYMIYDSLTDSLTVKQDFKKKEIWNNQLFNNNDDVNFTNELIAK